jgi:hypothetical protein
MRGRRHHVPRRKFYRGAGIIGGLIRLSLTKRLPSRASRTRAHVASLPGVIAAAGFLARETFAG